ncbi:DUF3742 family protein [Pseudomonas sp. BN417]|uniref:DUF3742 family protein n=1 Tax=Pseudomonas sp. BN417 TaxID=2567890 RepID=UPI002457809A|nr:DUF3742 family protein [Pseudomonas sp. BN417]MDH4556052.1 DUF3742 family protein [Pseudomonas sp. BN417]
MTTTTRISTAERLGRWLGRGWWSYVRREGRVIGWLAVRGVPVTMAKAFVWAFRLALMAGLLYVSFWIALLCIALAVVAAQGGAHHDGDLLEWTVHEYEVPRT